MSGSKSGGLRAAKTNKLLYGEDFYKNIGAKGGKNGHTGGFGQGEAGRIRASVYGRKGGKISRRGPANDESDLWPEIFPKKTYWQRIRGK